jgi:hypothetical protein
MTPGCDIATAVALLLLALLGCASTPPTPAPRAAVAIRAPRETVWSATVNVLADRSIPVKSLDRAAGLITTEEINIPAAETKQAGECRKSALRTTYPGRAQYTIIVSGDASATLRITSRLTTAPGYGVMVDECVSRGFLEQRLEQAVRDRVGGS